MAKRKTKAERDHREDEAQLLRWLRDGGFTDASEIGTVRRIIAERDAAQSELAVLRVRIQNPSAEIDALRKKRRVAVNALEHIAGLANGYRSQPESLEHLTQGMAQIATKAGGTIKHIRGNMPTAAECGEGESTRKESTNE